MTQSKMNQVKKEAEDEQRQCAFKSLDGGNEDDKLNQSSFRFLPQDEKVVVDGGIQVRRDNKELHI